MYEIYLGSKEMKKKKNLYLVSFLQNVVCLFSLMDQLTILMNLCAKLPGFIGSCMARSTDIRITWLETVGSQMNTEPPAHIFGILGKSTKKFILVYFTFQVDFTFFCCDIAYFDVTPSFVRLLCIILGSPVLNK